LGPVDYLILGDGGSWSEFGTGETTLALHPASEKNPPGTVELGFTASDVQQFHSDMIARGVPFSMPPTKQDFGGLLAQFLDSESCTAVWPNSSKESFSGVLCAFPGAEIRTVPLHVS
jgi:hypothetical protein